MPPKTYRLVALDAQAQEFAGHHVERLDLAHAVVIRLPKSALDDFSRTAHAVQQALRGIGQQALIVGPEIEFLRLEEVPGAAA